MSCEFNGWVRSDAYPNQPVRLQLSCEDAIKTLEVFIKHQENHASKMHAEFFLNSTDRFYYTLKPENLSTSVKKIETFLEHRKTETDELRLKLLLGANVGFWGC